MEDITMLKKNANQLRQLDIQMIYEAKSGHPGSSLSAIDILNCLFFSKLKHNPKKPDWEDRDRFVLSKGHGCPALYACLIKSGYLKEEEVHTFRKVDSRLQGHPEKTMCPGVEASAGPLGQGLSIANGIALAAKIDKKDYNVYCYMGDGETQEGQIWEAALSSSHFKLNNLIAILDNNKLQIDGKVEKVKNIEPIKEKWESFGWHVIEIDGHNYEQILKAFDDADNINQPVLILAHTIKGKGVSFMENKAEWHGVPPNDEEYKKAMEDLNESN